MKLINEEAISNIVEFLWDNNYLNKNKCSKEYMHLVIGSIIEPDIIEHEIDEDELNALHDIALNKTYDDSENYLGCVEMYWYEQGLIDGSRLS